jgi:hypothetical protein
MVDIAHLLKINKDKECPNMVAIINFMHYKWKNYPVIWHGHFTNKDGDQNIILEIVAN